MSVIALLQQQARRRTSDPLKAILDQIVAHGMSQIGSPYTWGGKAPPGMDCSGFISWAYGGRVRSYTDWIFDDTVESPDPLPGDIVLYEYDDQDQPNTRFPHVGLWLSDTETLDDRFPQGVGIHPHVIGANLYIRRVPGLVDEVPFGRFTNAQIAACLVCPIENVASQWPLVISALAELGIDDEPTEIAAIATIGVEANTFLPIEEYSGGYEYEGRADLGNTEPGDGHRFMGRGLIQLTGRANYRSYGQMLGVDLEGNPEMALDPNVSARVLATYFSTHNIQALANAGRWTDVRRAVNGGTNGISDFLTYVGRLQAVLHGG